MSKAPKLRVRHAGVIVLGRFSQSHGGGNLFVLNSLAKNGLTLPVQQCSSKTFVAKRFFVIRDVARAKAKRANHAHRTTSEAVFCINGSCAIHLDDGSTKQTIGLHDPAIGIVHGPGLWHAISDFSKDCVLLVLADTPTYDRAEYIYDYEEFLR